MENIDLNKVWEDCKVQNRKAQSQLYHYFSKKMHPVCLRYAHTTLEADDIMQNGFVKVFTKHHLFDGNGSLEGWIKRIMINTAIETHRKNKLNYAEALNEDQHIKLVSQLGADQTSYKDLLAVIQMLPLGYKTIFSLYAIEGYTHKEIADLLEISEGNSKSQLSRARQWLQQKLVKLELR